MMSCSLLHIYIMASVLKFVEQIAVIRIIMYNTCANF